MLQQLTRHDRLFHFLASVALASLALVCLPVPAVSQSAPASAIGAVSPASTAPAVFEAATIKPVKDADPGSMYDKVDGCHFLTHDTTLLQLMAMAYRVDKRQIVGAPDWMSLEQFDIDAVADTDEQLRLHFRDLLQGLLADRFQLVFHREQRDMPAYVLTVAKGGPKVTAADPKGQHTTGCQGLGLCTFRQEDMQHLSAWLQLFAVDRPVVDRTGLSSPYDFQLHWTPDAMQAANFGGHISSTTADDPNAPPGLFTAMEEQLGLKLVPEKTPTEVLVIDRVARPTAD